ncbi:MAG: hypothetical protein ACR2ID_09895 [Chthoniobacterales bacterium]
MSLKAFHILFIAISALLAMGCGAWCLWVNQIAGAPVYLTGAIFSFTTCLGLVVYGVWFWKKMKRLRIIT